MVTSTQYGNVTVLTIKGELTTETIDDLIDQRDQLLVQSRCRLVTDCAGLTALDSAGLESLNGTRLACEQLRGAMKLCSLDEVGRKILEITRLDRHFEVFDDLESAVRSFD